jgi:DNA-directed RNA polymerase specialized sigma24 family protein
VACARRDLLLAVHRHRLRREDLEDCYSQASLELISHARDGHAFASRAHIANALELRFLSRVRDRHRAIGGRSPMQAALEQAASLVHAGAAAEAADGGVDVIDAQACVERQVLARDDLRAIGRAMQRLTVDQRRVLASQLAEEPCEACCLRFGWSREKYRKLAQRARARLRESITSRDSVPSGREPSEEIAEPAYGYHSRS